MKQSKLGTGGLTMAEQKELTITLTHSQVYNLVEFIEMNLLDVLRNDTDIDNFDYVVDMCEAHAQLKKAMEADNG